MELNELIPQRVEWEPQLDEGRSVKLFFRPFNLEDEARLKELYPDNRLQEVFERLEGKELCKIAFFQLELESKRQVMKIKFMEMNEETGEEYEVSKTGSEKVGQLVKGIGGMTQLIDNLLKTRGLSLPLLEKIVEKMGIDGLKQMALGKK